MREVFAVLLLAAVLLLVLLVLLLEMGVGLGGGIKAVFTQVDEFTKV